MNPTRWVFLRARSLFGRGGLEHDMNEEMRAHVEQSTERLIQRGLSPADARAAARREFGNVTMLEEDGRAARGARWVDAVVGDLRFAFRYFARNKATVAIIVAVLALGTGSNTLMFSMMQAQYFRRAPALPQDVARVRIWAQERRTQTGRWEPRLFSHGDFEALAERRETFSEITGWVAHDVVFDGGDSTGARGVGAQFVTPDYFRVLGVPLAAGEGFARSTTKEPDMAAVISWLLAEQLYGDVRTAVGRQVLVNELPVRVVGVAPPRFQGALRSMDSPGVWVPVSARAAIARVSPRWLDEESALSLIARRAPDVSNDQATVIARQVVLRSLPDSAARVGMTRTAHVIDIHVPPPGNETAEAILVSTFIGSIGLLILLVACTNVSSLMVAAAMGRRHEIAVRLSLGASRIRLMRQLITESTLLALAGGAAGLMMSWWTLKWFEKAEIDGVDLMPDLGTFVFVLAMAVATGILFGLSPALHATRGGVANALRDSGAGATRRSRLQRTLVVAQIALSQPLLVLLAVMISLVIADYQPMSADVSQRVVSVGFRPLTQTGAPGQRREAVDSLMPRIASLPEVTGVVPEAAAFTVRNIVAIDRTSGARPDSTPTSVHVEGAAPGWFALLDVPILLGRDVSLEDTSATDYPVVIGSDLARTLWGGANPLGRTLASPVSSGTAQDSISLKVIGVYDASRNTTRGNGVRRVYTARDKHWRRDHILVRTRGGGEAFLPTLQTFIRDRAPGLPVTWMQTIAQLDEEERLMTLKIAAFAGSGGALALLLASLGLYGVVSLAVNQRRREIGIRIAVGAKPMRVARMFLASGVRAGTLALAIGLPLSMAGLRVAQSQRIIIAPDVNVWLIGGVIAVVLLLVAAAATWLPARRAAMIDPAVVLRVD